MIINQREKSDDSYFGEMKHTEAVWLQCYMDGGHRPRLMGRTSILAHLDRLIPVLYESTRKVLRPTDIKKSEIK